MVWCTYGNKKLRIKSSTPPPPFLTKNILLKKGSYRFEGKPSPHPWTKPAKYYLTVYLLVIRLSILESTQHRLLNLWLPASPDSRDPAVAKYHNVPNNHQLLLRLAFFPQIQRTQRSLNITISKLSPTSNACLFPLVSKDPVVAKYHNIPSIKISQLSKCPNNHQLHRLACFPLIQRTQLSPNILVAETIPKSSSQQLLRELATWVQERAERKGSPFHKIYEVGV